MKSASILAIAQVLCLVSAAPSASNKAVRGLNSDEANGVVSWINTILAEAYEKNPEVAKRAVRSPSNRTFLTPTSRGSCGGFDVLK